MWSKNPWVSLLDAHWFTLLQVLAQKECTAAPTKCGNSRLCARLSSVSPFGVSLNQQDQQNKRMWATKKKIAQTVGTLGFRIFFWDIQKWHWKNDGRSFKKITPAHVIVNVHNAKVEQTKTLAKPKWFGLPYLLHALFKASFLPWMKLWYTPTTFLWVLLRSCKQQVVTIVQVCAICSHIQQGSMGMIIYWIPDHLANLVEHSAFSIRSMRAMENSIVLTGRFP